MRVQKLNDNAFINLLGMQNKLADAEKSLRVCLKRRAEADDATLSERRAMQKFTEYEAQVSAYTALLKTLASVHFEDVF